MPQRPHETPPTADTGARDAQAVVASLRAGAWSSPSIYDAFWELDRLPPDDVRDALAAWLGPLPDVAPLDVATRRAHGLPLPALQLRTLSVARDADILDLGPIAEEQIRIAGRTWDDADLPAEERLDGELEGSFAGTLERRVLADATAPGDAPLFDVLLFAEDAGVVFAAGTTEVVALIAYRKVEMRDRRTRVAIEEAIGAGATERTPEAAPVAKVEARAVSETVKAKKTATTKKVAKTATVAPAPAEKKPSATKTAPKKLAAKKTAKKTAVTKAVAKKAVAKKAVAKKAVAKKTVKKTAAKKPAKKSAAKPAKPTPKRGAKVAAKGAKAKKGRGTAKARRTTR